MITNIIWGLARILAVFGFVVFFVSPAWDWFGGDGWEITSRAYERGFKSTVGMFVFEVLRFKRTWRNTALNRR